MIFVDTHVVVWLYANEWARFPTPTRLLIENSDLSISPVVTLELAYLEETGRLNTSSETIIDDLTRRVGLSVSDTPFAQVCFEARRLNWTRDPFDRIIAAHALADKTQLLTKDATIRMHLDLAVWPAEDA